MSVNKFFPHILVLPEDDATRQLANGFLLEPAVNGRAIQVLPPARGWTHVRDVFKQTHVAEMNRYPHRYMVLLVDFDQDEDRLKNVQQSIPEDLKDRVFVLGVWSEPENLKRQLNSTYEQVGTALAAECRSRSFEKWNHELLKHNEGERSRMLATLRPILFASV